MGDGYTARFPWRWRLGIVVGALAVSWPVLLQISSWGLLVLAGLLICAQAGAFWVVDRRPLVAALVVLGGSAGLQVIHPGVGPGLGFVVLCTYAWLRPVGEALRGLGLGIVLGCLPAVLRAEFGQAGLWLGGVVLAWSWGALARALGARRQAERRQAVLEERARIARELHDVLSHTVSVMVVQAAAADDVFDVDPARAREAVRRTEQAGREALAELRWFLRSVRGDGDAGGGPQPTLDDIAKLAATMTAAGLPVAVEHAAADFAAVPLGVQLTAYRIVQEALTNTLRHARATRGEVLVRVAGGEVYVRVRDDGRGGSTDSGGQGIAGMRERARLAGGSLAAGARAGGGFEVAARLPYGEGS